MSAMTVAKELILYSGPIENLPAISAVLGEEYLIERTEPTPDALLPRLEHAVAFLDASMKVRIPSETIKRAARLRIVVCATTGADHIDADALSDRGIPLLTLRGRKEVLNTLTPAAELSWLLVLSCARHIRAAIHHVETGEWDRVQFPGLMLKGKTVGIIGLGRLGSWAARYAHAFDMNVWGFDPFTDSAPEHIHKTDHLEELLESSDVVTIHVNLTPDNKNMLSRQILAHIKQGAILVNTSRSDLVDETAIVDLLASGQLAAYGTDVLGGEPDITHNSLWIYAQEHDNVIITPHIGGFSPQAVDTVVDFSAKRIRDFLHTGSIT